MSSAEAQNLVSQHFGLKGSIKKLAGDVDFNFVLKSADQSYSLKFSRPGVDKIDWDFQEAILDHLLDYDFPFSVPQLIPALDGRKIIPLDGDRLMRVQSWVPGKLLGDVTPQNSSLLKSWGTVTAHLTKALNDFDHPAAHRAYKWDPSRTLESEEFEKYFKTDEEKSIGQYFWMLFKSKFLPVADKLRKGVNYNDAHQHNLLIDKIQEDLFIDGVIDFGDALYTHSVNDIAIACAYGCMDKLDPLRAATIMVAAYHKVFPLTKEECEVLFPMIGARLMITVSNAAWARHKEPENQYLSISEKPAWMLLKKLKDVSPEYAIGVFKKACGYDATDVLQKYNNWLSSKPVIADVVDLESKSLVPIDLSIGSTTLGNNSNYENPESFSKLISRYLEDNRVHWAYGGYNESRPIYTSDMFQDILDDGPQWRTKHLGLDFWSDGEEDVYAPIDSIVFSVFDNAGNLNYGPTVILRHDIEKDFSFYTLYGHLNSWCLENIEVGQKINRGQKIAEIGRAPQNGNWPAHLHFQLILDMLGNSVDFPGVFYADRMNTWLDICPDPIEFLGIENQYSSADLAEEIFETRQASLGKSLSLSYANPLHIVRGYKQYLYDKNGRRYLDTANNVAHVGHEHPRVVKAAQNQIGVLNTNTRYLHKNITQFAQRLLKHFPPELSVVHFVNSGSEANELAIRMAKTYTNQNDMIAVEVGYHGSTGACIDVSSYKFDGKGGKGAPPYTEIVPIPDSYRGKHIGENTGQAYAQYVENAIQKIQSKGRNVAGFICESILSCGGQIVLPEGYLEKAFEYVRAAGGLNIIDEVQVGFGRVGSHYWGFELQNVVPDIVTMGKPIGNGHPLAAVVTTREVADAFANGMEYFSTFGGNPVSCAIGAEVLSIIEDEGLKENAKEVGSFLLSGLKELQKKFSIIGDVRGHGLFLGFELVRNRKTKEPADIECAYLANRMRQLGFLLSTDGPFHNVTKIKPPMCFSKENAEQLLEFIEKVLKETFMNQA